MSLEGYACLPISAVLKGGRSAAVPHRRISLSAKRPHRETQTGVETSLLATLSPLASISLSLPCTARLTRVEAAYIHVGQRRHGVAAGDAPVCRLRGPTTCSSRLGRPRRRDLGKDNGVVPTVTTTCLCVCNVPASFVVVHTRPPAPRRRLCGTPVRLRPSHEGTSRGSVR